MASRTQATLYDSFKALASGGAVVAALQSTAAQISDLKSVATSSSQSTGNAVISAVSKVFTNGLGLVPLIGGLFGLFGGGGKPEPPPLVKYTMPERVYFQGADIPAGMQSADYDQLGIPRAFGPIRSTGAAGSTPTSSATAQINVNVQAMDARSFLDHSNEIAQAVRQAMLNLNSINDVVSDL